VLEYVSECQISTLDRVRNKPAKFSHHSGVSDWESLAQRRKKARIFALYKAYTGQRTWKAIRDRLQTLSYLSRVDQHWEIRARKQRTDIGKYYVEIKYQLDATEVFIADRIACSTCFRHHYKHHQELKGIIQ